MNAPQHRSQHRIAQSFGRSQASYSDEARPQRLFARALARRLAQLRGSHHEQPIAKALEFGHGSGHLTEALGLRFRFETLWLNDLVAPLPALVPPPAAQVIALPGPVERVSLPQGLDLIASASSLQWIADPAALIARFGAALRPGGWLALSSFGPNHFAELAALHPTARAPALLPPEALAAALPPGWRIHALGEARLAQFFPSPLALLHHLRRTGVNGLARSVWTKRDLADFIARYQAQFAWKSGVRLSWNPVWLIAEKP
ncbi:methyltransferase domain-containing protein [Paracoccus aminophilus]|uniref:Biotin synthesis protein BioC n=1 Tax=Paracoccus aminophilus JCM 7686 TaxID=1367847 RepID=S5XSJ4_PARAH|nr:methyltransferase domain-containing protein [Paracoccus aminophilus]AGT08077.1 biotin synthesis protein BioC [Paracoccus aminophilus JCM 7686]